jgi:DNA-binding GntR family transcriptional regulator
VYLDGRIVGSVGVWRAYTDVPLMPHAARCMQHAGEGRMAIIERGPNLGEQVYAFVRDRIVSGFYRPGQVINESELAAELEVSRTPVSNALIMLKERGLVEGWQGRLGVPRLTIDDVRDLYRCRVAFDALATRLAAERMSAADLAALERDLHAWDTAEHDDAQTLWVADLGFHERIYAMSGNRHLIRFAQIAADLVAVYRHATIRRLGAYAEAVTPRTRSDVHAEHRRIFDALGARDPGAAEAAARAHIDKVIAHLDTLDVADPGSDDDAAQPSAAAASL